VAKYTLFVIILLTFQTRS